jgi:hypothetical protein
MASGNKKTIIEVPLSVGIDEYPGDENKRGASRCENMDLVVGGRATKISGWEDVDITDPDFTFSNAKALVGSRKAIWTNVTELDSVAVKHGNGLKAYQREESTGINVEAGYWSNIEISELMTTSKNLNLSEISEMPDSARLGDGSAHAIVRLTPDNRERLRSLVSNRLWYANETTRCRSSCFWNTQVADHVP